LTATRNPREMFPLTLRAGCGCKLMLGTRNAHDGIILQFRRTSSPSSAFALFAEDFRSTWRAASEKPEITPSPTAEGRATDL
jgi:hypothetical protein